MRYDDKHTSVTPLSHAGARTGQGLRGVLDNPRRASSMLLRGRETGREGVRPGVHLSVAKAGWRPLVGLSSIHKMVGTFQN